MTAAVPPLDLDALEALLAGARDAAFCLLIPGDPSYSYEQDRKRSTLRRLEINAAANLPALIAAAREAEVLREALEKIAQWADAYPLNVFPEPDFKLCAELLKSGGQTLDAVSASNMRHVVDGVGQIARAALNSPLALEDGA
ncbi:MAG: hypothetical protein M3Y22_18505 [Pseudomonadota bacterium]|nr:hypothetical protein [Pseudomonadota bacterium]